jgi:hypothetical protein
MEAPISTTWCCDANKCKHHVMLVYSPWVNGLVEGTNKILLHMLKCLCAPEVGESNGEGGWEKLPKNWPNHLDEAVKALNHWILPMLKFSPKELLLGITINMPKLELEHAIMEPTAEEAAIHMAYMAQQRLDRYEATVKHTITWKRTFDKGVLKGSGEVIFKKGQLVQVYQSNLDQTLKTKWKLLPKWSHPHQVRR